MAAPRSLATLLLLLAAGCASKEVREERDRLKIEVSVLEGRIGEAESKRSVLAAQLKRRDGEVDDLRARVRGLEAQVERAMKAGGAPKGDASAPVAPMPDATARPGAERVHLVIDGTPLLASDIAWGAYARFGPRLVPTLLSDRLVESAAVARGIDARDEEVEQVVEMRHRGFERQAGGPDGLSRSLSESYVTVEEFRALQRPDARHVVLAAKLINERLKSDDGLRRLYEVRFGERRRGRHILYTVDPTKGPADDADAAARKRAEDAKARLEKGADFARLAEEESQDPGSARNGGKLPEFNRHMMVPSFSELAFSLKAGEVGGPVRSEFGWHLIRIDEVVPAGKTFEEAKDELLREISDLPVTQVEGAEYNRLIEDLKAAARIERP